MFSSKQSLNHLECFWTWTTSSATTWSSFIRVQTIKCDIDASDRKREFLTGAYFSDNNVGELQNSRHVWGGNPYNLSSLLPVHAVTHNPTTGVITQVVQRFNNRSHIPTSLMQSLVFPPGIVTWMHNADNRHHRDITPTSLYSSIRVAIKLVHKSSPDIVFGVAVEITNCENIYRYYLLF